MSHSAGYDDYAFIADLYDFVVPYRDRPDVAFFVSAAQETGGPVLEVGCGTGRVLIPTARSGAAITGLDASPYMSQSAASGWTPKRPRCRIGLIW